MKPKFNLEQCDSLKALCEKELRRTHKAPPQKFSLMLPSIEALLYLVGIIFSIFLFSMALLAIPFFQEINEHIRPTFSITPTIFIGIIAAIIAICTFVLEYTNSDKKNGRALVANSYFYALFITYMTTLFFILQSHLFNNYLFPIFGFIVIYLWLIFAFHKTVIFIIFSAKRNQLIDKFYISLFDQAYAEAYIYDEIKNFADQQLISLELLDYKFFGQNNPNYKYIRANQNGFVLDISLKALIQFAKQLNSPIYLYPTISRKVKMGDALIAIPNTDNLDLGEFNSLINIFTISDHLLFLNEFDELEVSTIESMKNENKTNIQKNFDLYKKLILHFYKLEKPLTRKQAYCVMQNNMLDPFMCLVPFRSLERSIYPWCFKQIDTLNFPLLWQFHKDVLFLAIRNQDYYFFNMQIQYFQIPFYSAVKDVTDPTIGKSEAWDFLRRIFMYQISDVINSNPERYKEYVICILQAFQQLFKLAFDANKDNDFREMLQSYLNLFVDQTYSSESDQSTKALFEFRQQVRSCILFEFMAYLLHVANNNSKWGERCKNFFSIFMENKTPLNWNSFSSLSNIYLNAKPYEYQSYWAKWCMESSSGGAFELEQVETFRRLYVVLLLKLDIKPLRLSGVGSFEDKNNALKQEKTQLIEDLKSIEMWASFLDMTQTQADELIQKIESSPFFNPQTTS